MTRSAGLLLYRRRPQASDPRRLEVLLVHPGGPYFAKKDAGFWGIPKGLIESGEDELEAARREFTEETSIVAKGEFVPLGEVRLPSGKIVAGWAVEQDADPETIVSNTFEMEWPPKSGRKQAFPEIDRAGWFTLDAAAEKIAPAQAPFLSRLKEMQSRS